MKIYVGNISSDTDEGSLRDTFAEYGDVDDVAIITDRETGQSRGFGFVIMPNDAEAQGAIGMLDGTELGGRTIKVIKATGGTGPRRS